MTVNSAELETSCIVPGFRFSSLPVPCPLSHCTVVVFGYLCL